MDQQAALERDPKTFDPSHQERGKDRGLHFEEDQHFKIL